MTQTRKSSPATLRRAAWAIYREPLFVRDQKQQQANLAAHGAPALCDDCAGTGNAFLFIYVACRACEGTGLQHGNRSTRLNFQN